MTTTTKNSTDSALEPDLLDVKSSAVSPSDVMTDAPILFSFIDYLRARRGIDRDAALELITNYMMARAAAHMDATHPATIAEPQCTNDTARGR